MNASVGGFLTAWRSMRNLVSPIFGRVRALEAADLTRHQPLFTVIEYGFRSQIAQCAVDLAGAISGLYAISPAICVPYAPPRTRGAGVEMRPVITPGIHYGTDLWEPYISDVIETLAQHGIEAFYDPSITGTVEQDTLQLSSAAEVRTLFVWLESHRVGAYQNQSMSQKT